MVVALTEFKLSERDSTIEEWLAGRKTAHLSTNSGADPIAFQWRNFKEAFAPELVAQAVEETSNALGREVRTSIDPFGGSGTTALASQFLGVNPVTIEVNPYLADLIEAKLSSYDVSLLLDDYKSLLSEMRAFDGEAFPGAPKTFVAPGVDGRFIFGKEVAAAIGSLRAAINVISNDAHRRLFRVILSSLAIDVSNVVVSGKGRRYRKNWERNQSCKSDVLEKFDALFSRAVYDIARFRNRPSLEYRILRGSCLTLIPTDERFDIAVFSPPYPNSFDYTDVYNVELWAGAYLLDGASNRDLRLQTLRSHVQIKRSFDAPGLQSESLSRILTDLHEVKRSLWNRSIPDMVGAYFHDMQQVLRKIALTLVPRGRAYLVVGDSRYHGVQIPVADILCELASPLGLHKIGTEPFRSMRASPQQGGRPELLETLVVFERSNEA